jgi:hypothetical protein
MIPDTQPEPLPESFRWLLIGGAPRSGTTLLYHLLKSHPALALRNEKDLLERLKSAGPRAAAEDFLTVIRPGQRDGLIYLGEKKPEYYEAHLSRVFAGNEPTVIHISRRPDLVIDSMLRRTAAAAAGDDPAWSRFFSEQDGIDTWLRAWQFAVAHRDAPWLLHLKYEDLVSDPEHCMSTIFAHLGLNPGPYDRAMIQSEPAERAAHRTTPAFERQLGEISRCWDLPLEELERRFEHLRPGQFSGLRRIKRRLLWALSVKETRPD